MGPPGRRSGPHRQARAARTGFAAAVNATVPRKVTYLQERRHPRAPLTVQVGRLVIAALLEDAREDLWHRDRSLDGFLRRLRPVRGQLHRAVDQAVDYVEAEVRSGAWGGQRAAGGEW